MIALTVVCFILFLPIKTILITLQNVLHNQSVYCAIKLCWDTVNCTEWVEKPGGTAVIIVCHQIVSFINYRGVYSEVGKLVLHRMCICRDFRQGTAKFMSRSTIICILNRFETGLVSDTVQCAGTVRWAVSCSYLCFVSARQFCCNSLV